MVVARHGKLIYESYFDGDASTLRDTRSSTKSITDIWLESPFGKNKLGGVKARVLPLLPEHAKNGKP